MGSRRCLNKGIARKGLLTLVLMFLAFTMCVPQLAFAQESTQVIDGTMTITLQGGASGGGASSGAGAPTAVATSTTTSGGVSSSVLTGDTLIWLILGIAVLLAGAVYVFIKSRRLVGAGAMAGTLAKDPTSTKRNTIIVAVVTALVACACFGMFASKSNAFAKEGISSIAGTSNVVVDDQGNVLSNDLVITNNSGKAIFIKNVQAPDELNSWNASIKDETLQSGSSTKGTWDGKTIPATLLEQVKNNSSSNIKLSLKITITDTEGSLDFDKFTVNTESAVYDGSQIRPAVTSDIYQQGTDYEVTYGENKNAGEGTITIKGIGSYKGEQTFTFTIGQKELALKWDDQPSFTYEYDGKSHAPSATISGEIIEGDTVNITVDGAQVNVGTYTATATIDNANYKLSSDSTQSFTISPKELTLTWSGPASFIYEYNGKPHVPTASAEGVVKDDMVIVDVDGAKTEAGTYKAVATIDNDNYRLPSDNTKEFTIAKAKIVVSGITAKDKTYDGTSSAELVFDDVKLDGKIDKDDVSITAQGTFSDANAEYFKKVNITNIVLTGDASNNYELAEQGQQTSAKASIMQRVVELEWGSVELSYNGKAQVPQVKVANAVQGEKVDITVTAKDGKEAIAAGTYEAIPSALSNNNYTLPQDISSRPFIISPAFLAITGIKPAPKTYDGTTKANLDTSALSISGTIEGDDVSVSAQGTFENANAGKEKEVSLSYELGGSAKDNYQIDFSASVMSLRADINPASIDQDKITISSDGTTYNGSQLTPRVTIEGLTQGTDFDVSYGKNINAGKEAGSLTVKGKGNYTGEYPKTFEIKKADPNPTAPEGLTAETGQTLADVTLPRQTEPVAGSFAWEAKDPSKVFVGEADTTPSFNAVFTPDDTNNYNTQVVPVTIKVTKVKSAFAVYFTNGTLGFYHRVDIPKEKDKLDGKTVDQVYENIEDANYQPKWLNEKITSATVVDSGIQPKSTAKWFALANASELTTIDVTKLDTSKTTDMSSMFEGCGSLTTVGDLFNWSVSNVKNTSSMFKGCSSLASIGDISYWNTSKVTTMASMFEGCNELTSVGDISKWKENTANVTNMTSMFKDCARLVADCSDWKVDNVKDNHKDFDTGAPGVQSPWDTPLVFDKFVVDTKSQTYSAKQIMPSVTSSDYTKDTDYEVVYGENKNVGEGTITIKGLNKYEGEQTYTFAIEQKGLTLTWDEQVTFTYDGTMHAPSANINGVIEGDAVNLSVQGAKDAGDHEAKASIDNKNYKLSNASTKSFTINPKQISLTWSGDIFVYNGKPQAPTATAEGVIEGDTVNITVEGAQTNASDTAYTAKATKLDSANYKLAGEATKSFSIQKAKIVVSGITAKDKFYDGTTNAELSYSNVTLAGKVDKDNLTVSAKASFKDANAGTDKEVNITNLTLAGASLDNYELASEGQQTSATATINPITIDKTITISTEGTTYTGSQLTPQVSIESLEQDKDFTLSFGGNIRAGKDAGSVSITGIGNYTGTQTKYFDIAKANPGYNTPEGISAEAGQILADVVLPVQTEPVKGTFDWKNPSTSVGDKIGTYTFKANFIPEDTNNYNVVENIEIAVKVVEAQEKTTFAIYCAKDNSLNFYNRSSVPTAGTEFDGKVADDVYTDIDKNSYDYDSIPWKNHRSTLKTATVVDTGIDPESLGYWFDDCTALNSVDLTKLNTYKVKSMHHMFYNSAVKQLDLSSFDTSNVTSMANMFTNCTRLSSISGIANWNTSNVVDMYYMFDGCANLASVGNISKWDTSKVIDMNYMFANCANLVADCATWNVQKVGNEHLCFNENASTVRSPWDGHVFAIYSADDSSLSFYKRSTIPQAGSKYDGKIATEVYVISENVIYDTPQSAPWNGVRAEIKSVNFASEEISPISTAYWFSDCSELTSFKPSKLNVTFVANTDFMFAGCSKLASIEGISDWDTSRAESMTAMFKDCVNLTADCSHWNVKKVGDKHENFNYQAPTVKSPWDLDAYAVYFASDNSLGFYKSSVVPQKGTEFDGKIATEVYTISENATYSTPQSVPWNSVRAKIKSVNFTDKIISPISTAYWFSDCNELISVDTSKLSTIFVENMESMFAGCSKLTSIKGVSDWDTRHTENMSAVFKDCSNLVADCIAWNVEKVGDNHKNFNENAPTVRSPWDGHVFAIYSADDSSLSFYKRSTIPQAGSKYDGKIATEVYVISENVIYDTPQSAPWNGVRAEIKSVNFASEEISPISTAYWFSDCSELTSFKPSKLNVTFVANTDFMFAGCSKLASIEGISDWDTSRAESMTAMFKDCVNLTADCSHWNVKKVGDKHENFNYQAPTVKSPWDLDAYAVYFASDNSLGFYKSSVVPQKGTEFDGKIATEVYTISENATYSTPQSVPWNSVRAKIKSVNFTDKIISPISTAYWFSDCNELISVDTSKLSTIFVENMESMFAGCSKLTSIKGVSDWDTRHTENMSAVFKDCSNLVADCAVWNVEKVGDNHKNFNYQAPYVKSVWDKKSFFAVYSADDNSLTFYSGIVSPDEGIIVPKEGSTYKGKTVTAVYTDIENTGASKESVPWNEMRKYIKVVEVADSGVDPVSTAYWFSDCIYLTSLNISKLNTSKLTNMSSMFSGLNTGASLYSIDLSGLNTSTVTDMSSLFAGSTSLRSITGLSTWDTSNVTNMNSMFSECRMLTSVADLSSWNTENVTDMGSMFRLCVSLTSVGDLSNWKTSKVEDMSSLFEDCFHLASIGDLSNWNTSNVLNMSYMFDDCSSLTSIGALQNWDVSKVVNMRCMFYYCTGLVGAEGLSDWKPSSAENMDYMFSNCSKLDADLVNWPQGKAQKKHYAFNRDASKIRSPWERCFAIYSDSDHSLSFYKRDVEEVPSVGSTFEGKSVSKLYMNIDSKTYDQYLDVPWQIDELTSSIATATVVDEGIRPISINWWFYDCGNMVSADLSKLNTSKTKGMHAMFYMMTSRLTTVGDISNWDTSKVEDMGNMFGGCSSLVADCSRWNVERVSAEASEGFNSRAPHVKSPWDRTSFAVYSETDNSLNFYKTRIALVPTEGSVYKDKVVTKLYTGFDEATYDKDSIPWAEYRSSIKSVEVVDNDISAKSTAYWFSDCTQLASAEISKLNTSNITDMNSMFLNCTSLISIEGFDNWNLDKVANLSSMFNGCSKLETIGDISHWNISKVEHIESMFAGCSELRLVGDLSGWDTSKIVSMESMFNGCSKLGMLGDLSKWNVSNAKNMKSMFQDCSSLISIGSLSDWKTSKVEDMSSMFNNCSRLVAYCSDWDVAKVGDNHTDFNLNAPNVKSPWQTAFAVYSETDHSLNFYERSTVPKAGDIFENKKVTAVYKDIDKSAYQSDEEVPWKDYRTLILSSSVVDEEISPSSTAYWFTGCNALTSVDLSKLNTYRVKSMYAMFSQTKLTSLDLSNFDTSNVTDMAFLFYDCSSLTSVKGLSNWNTDKLEDMNVMFYGCSNLTSVGDLSNWNTCSVIFMWGTFNGCAKLATLGDISAWDTGNVGNMQATFKDCKKLVADCSNWNVAGVKDNSNFNDGAPNVISPWGAITFAMYSEADHSLSFYKRNSTPKAGDTFDDKKVTAVYTDITSDTYTADTVPWEKYCSELTSVKVVDAGVSPVSTAYWFNNCSVLTSVDLSKLKTSNVTNMSNMFAGCAKLQKTDLENFDTSKVTDMSSMFAGSSALTTVGDISGWNTSSVTNMDYMFVNCEELKADCSNWNASRAGDNHIDFNRNAPGVITPWDKTAFAVYSSDDNSLNFYRRSSMPEKGTKFEDKVVTEVYTGIESDVYDSGDSVPWKDNKENIKKVNVVDEGIKPVSTAFWFYVCKNLTSMDISKLDTSSTTTMSNMFDGCKNLVSSDLSILNTSSVMNFHAMFLNCSNLVSIGDISEWDTSNATDTHEMFSGCANLVSLGDISQWKTSNVTNVIMMFNRCTKLIADCSTWDVAKASDHWGFNYAANGVKSPSWNTNVSLESTSANQGTLGSQSGTGLVDENSGDKASATQEKDASVEEKSTNQTDDSSVGYSAQREEESSAESSNGIAGSSNNSEAEKVKLVA